MPALPPTTDFTTAGTQTLAQTAYGNQRAFLAGLLGTDGVVGTALATLGAFSSSYVARTSAYTATASNRGALIHATSGTWSLTLLAAATATAGFSLSVLNGGTGTITIDPNGSETVDGATTLALPAGSGVILVCTGTAWITLPLPGVPQASAVDATARRVLRNSVNGGAFGLGNTGNLAVAADMDSISLPSGWHAFNSGTTGTRPADIGPSILGCFEVVVFDSGIIHQRLWRNQPSGLNGGFYKRVYASGAWQSWDAVVMRSTLLGTVAQTGGVPTGAVIEAGANANGEYVRFADGTQICAIGNLSAANASTALGALFRSADVAWTFPAVFASTSHLVIQPDFDDSDCWGASNSITTTGCNVRVIAAITKASAINGRALAVGRWF